MRLKNENLAINGETSNIVKLWKIRRRRTDISIIGLYGRWTSLKTDRLVLSAARKDNQQLVHQDGTSMPGAAVPGKYPVNKYMPRRCPSSGFIFPGSAYTWFRPGLVKPHVFKKKKTNKGLKVIFNAYILVDRWGVRSRGSLYSPMLGRAPAVNHLG